MTVARERDRARHNARSRAHERRRKAGLVAGGQAWLRGAGWNVFLAAFPKAAERD